MTQQGWRHGQKAKKPPGNSFQKNFIFQFDCAASSPLCYAIWSKQKNHQVILFKKTLFFSLTVQLRVLFAMPYQRKDNRLYKRTAGNGGAAAAASARKWRQFDLSTVLKQNVCLYLCVICRYNIYKKDFLYTTKF